MKLTIPLMRVRGLMATGLGMLSVCSSLAAGSDKTLVSWVCLANTSQQGGGALTVQCGNQFDGIVFGEQTAGRWMAGSEFFKRTQSEQGANAAEQANAETLVQRAIVSQGNRLAIPRNGDPYASYEANKVSQLKPYAWWTFKKGKETARMGRFPINHVLGGARIKRGRLVLASSGATLIASTGKIAGNTPTVLDTPAAPAGPTAIPAMPASPPPNWLTYHLIHPGPGGAFPGDPNCACYWKGKYHLHYIYNHDGVNFSHVSSDDMPDVKNSEDISCPNFFKIGNQWMLLCISHNLGCRYYLGDWKNEKQEGDIAVKSDAATKLKELSGNTLELEVTIKAPTAKECGVDVLCDKHGTNGVRVSYIPTTKTLMVGNVDAPFELKPGADLTLRAFIDKNLVEVFANDRQAALTARRGYAPENLGISLFSTGSDVMVKQVKGWKMKSSLTDK